MCYVVVRVSYNTTIIPQLLQQHYYKYNYFYYSYYYKIQMNNSSNDYCNWWVP